ncbi:ASCH domain-containing protein [Sagittula salina]|uniref:ASCH domain-containing protein n=1 Tax=Sagittula salina TaxID=2820268 RepID=A0A940MPU7_9RHOB|nr:ASCH domain-containing protein [Sagittula salina]MBP0481932.1 ASCH domain-containing protein [Sagittula salina]
MSRKSLQEIIDANPEAETFRYGDSETLCREILALVRSGKKTATVEAMRVYSGKGADALPEVGRRDVALEWDGRPALMVETVEVSVRRFDEMDEGFVAMQGEFRDLAHWRKAYRAYFSRSGGVSEDMEIMCERFRVVEDYARPAAGAGPQGRGGAPKGCAPKGGGPERCRVPEQATAEMPGRGQARKSGPKPGSRPGNRPGRGSGAGRGRGPGGKPGTGRGER